MSELTPGPWHLTKDAGAVWGTGKKIAEISSANGDKTANANAIAAVPEMLAALEMASSQWHGMAHRNLCVMPAIRAAIAKARGNDASI